MKILYAVQGTGNGHVSRAMEIVPILKKKAEVDVMLSGTQSDLELPFEVKYKLKGLSFMFGKQGGIDYLNTYLKNKTIRLMKEINKLPVEDYDLVINDFEPVSAWAAKIKNIPIVGLSHQAAVLNPNAPQPKKSDKVGRFVLNNYAPVKHNYGFHFMHFDSDIYTPVIRSQIRNIKTKNEGHYTVYLPAYDEEKIIKRLSVFEDTKWVVFSKYATETLLEGNVIVHPVDNKMFIKSLATCEGILCGAGFETPAEALFLKKKLMVIPMKSQYEQHCNAAGLAHLGVPVIKSLKKKHLPKIGVWLKEGKIIEVDYPDKTEQIIDMILKEYHEGKFNQEKGKKKKG